MNQYILDLFYSKHKTRVPHDILTKYNLSKYDNILICYPNIF